MLDTLKKYPLVPVFFHADAEYVQNLLQACYDGGMRLFEFTNRGPEAPEVFAHLRDYSKRSCPGLLLGIGTIYRPEEAKRFIDLGADFVVQPVTTVEVGEVCKRHAIPWAPGGMTPTEIYRALQLGADVVKVFPGVTLGPDFIKALRGPLPDAPLMVNGGMQATVTHVKEWFKAGVTAMGIGASQFFQDRKMQDFDALRENVANLLAAVE